MEPVKLDSPVEGFVVSVSLDSQEQTVIKVVEVLNNYWLINLIF